MVQNLLIQSINAVGEYTFGNYTNIKFAYSNLKFKHYLEEVDTEDQCFIKHHLNIQGDPAIIEGYLYAEITESLKYLEETITKYDDGGDIIYDEIPSAMGQITQIAALAHSKGYFQDGKWETIKNDILKFYHWYQENFFEEITIPDDKAFTDLNFDGFIEHDMLEIFYPNIDNQFWVPEYMELPTFIALKGKLDDLLGIELKYLAEIAASCFGEDEYWSKNVQYIQDINIIISYVGDEVLGNQLDEYEILDSNKVITTAITTQIPNKILLKAYLEFLLTQEFETSGDLEYNHLLNDQLED